MKYFFSLILFLALGTGCKQKVLAGKELEDKLKKTMERFLDKTLDKGVKFKIEEMSYFPEKKKHYYICTFHVSMRKGDKDTTGIMTAFIPNDFSKVDRTQ